MKRFILLLIFAQALAVKGQELKLGLPVGHSTAFQVAYSPDGKRIVTYTYTGVVKVWDAATAKVLYSLDAHQAEIKEIRFSVDWTILATCAADKKIRLWRLDNGSMLHSLEGHEAPVSWIRFMPDKKRLISYADDSTVRIWDIKKGHIDTIYRNVGHAVYGDNTLLISGDRNLVLSLNGKVKGEFSGYWPQISENGLYFGSSVDSGIAIWRSSDVKKTAFVKTDSKNIRFSPDGKYFSISEAYGITVYAAVSAKKLYSIDLPYNLSLQRFSADGRYLAILGYSPSGADVFELETGKQLLHRQEDRIDSVDNGYIYYNIRYNSIGFNAWGHVCISDDVPGATIIDLATDKNLGRLETYTKHLRAIHFTPDQKRFVVMEDSSYSIWSAENGKMLKRLHVGDALMDIQIYRSNSLITLQSNGRIYFWNLDSAQITSTFNHQLGSLKGFEYLEEKAQLLLYGYSGFALFKIDSGFVWRKELSDKSAIYGLEVKAVSPDRQLLVYQNQGEAYYITDIQSGKDIASLPGTWYERIFFSKNRKYLFLLEEDYRFHVGDNWPYPKNLHVYTADGQLLTTLYLKNKDAPDFTLSADLKYLAVLKDMKSAVIWDLDSFRIIRNIEFGLTAKIARFNATNDFQAIDAEMKSISWDLRSGKQMQVVQLTDNESDPDSNRWYAEILDKSGILIWKGGNRLRGLKIYALGTDDFIHLNSEGQFDASPAAMERMYWLKGSEIIEFSQLKDRYWVPDLIEKTMRGEELPKVRGMGSIKLQPEVERVEVSNDMLRITLKKRDGGYGKVAVFINSKELTADARGPGFDQNAAKQTLTISLKDHPYLLNGDNIITVKAASADNFVQGRGASISYLVKEGSSVMPRYFAVVIGVGKYSNPAINLRYPVSDALAISEALKIGASNLFGGENTFIYTLVSDGGLRPNKQNIMAVFDSIAQKAKSADLITVYMSGHGVTWGGVNGDFYFLTADAASSNADAFADPELRTNHTISTSELVEALKRISALKQLMILDACGSGKAVDNLLAARSVDASQIKAIDRMRDRTGMFIISGCAADALSYEASRYGQGLLTYSILRAMKGAGLRNDRFVDVAGVLSFASNDVPELAQGVGGIQKPQLLMPKAGSFDIGILGDEDKKKINISEPKPVFIRSNFIDLQELDDALQLGKMLDEALNERASSGPAAKMVFFDVREYPGAIKVSGTYSQSMKGIQLKLKIKNADTVIEKEISASDKEALLRLILAELDKVGI